MSEVVGTGSLTRAGEQVRLVANAVKPPLRCVESSSLGEYFVRVVDRLSQAKIFTVRIPLCRGRVAAYAGCKVSPYPDLAESVSGYPDAGIHLRIRMGGWVGGRFFTRGLESAQ